MPPINCFEGGERKREWSQGKQKAVSLVQVEAKPAPDFPTFECWNHTWLWHQAMSFNMFWQPCMPLSMHCVLFYDVWVGLALSGYTYLCVCFFQILVKSWRNLFPISWPFITNPKWLQWYLQTYTQEALRIGFIIYLPRSSVKPVFMLI